MRGRGRGDASVALPRGMGASWGWGGGGGGGGGKAAHSRICRTAPYFPKSSKSSSVEMPKGRFRT